MKKRIFIICTSAAAIIVLFAFIAVYNGIILLNDPSEEKYPVRGVDVSSYQGEIEWNVIASQNIKFAFIKATEGSSLADKYFESNLKNALEAGLRVGAYHFFSYDSSALTQAENFIAVVPMLDGMLPPVADVEFYGDYNRDPPDAGHVKTELRTFLEALEANYGLKPIIYATEKSYNMYIKGNFDEYDIWIRNVITSPQSLDNWTFWQYTNRAVLKGYNGTEKYIDINVFNGTQAEFEKYPN